MILEPPGWAARKSSSGCSTKSDTRCRLAAGSSGSGGGAAPGGAGGPAHREGTCSGQLHTRTAHMVVL